MKTWIMRIVGVVNLLCGLIGVYYFAFKIRLHWHNWPGSPSESQWLVFFVLSFISIYLLIYLGYLGIRLIKNDATALRPLRNLFMLEIAYYVASVVMLWVIMPLSMATIAVSFWGMAQDPFAPQILTGYPLIGIIATIVLSRPHKIEGDLCHGPASQLR